MTLGVIFLILIVIGGYVFVTDPFELRSMFSPSSEMRTEAEMNASFEASEGGESRFSAPQRVMLEAYGIDPDEVPTSLTSEQEACVESKLGSSRVAEIKAGGTPTPAEFYTARDCW